MKFMVGAVSLLVCAVLLGGCGGMKPATFHWEEVVVIPPAATLYAPNTPVTGCPGITTDAGNCYIQGNGGSTRGGGGIYSGPTGPTVQPYIRR